MKAIAIAAFALALPVPWTRASSAAEGPSRARTADEVVDAFIASKTREWSARDPADIPAAESREARRFLSADLDGDRKPEVVVQYTLEKGNLWTIFVAVFSGNERGRNLADLRVGEKGYRSARVTRVRSRIIELAVSDYGPNDAMCCPSRRGRRFLRLRDRRLEESRRERR